MSNSAPCASPRTPRFSAHEARKTGFNIFASQGDQKRIMQETTMAVLNRKIDAQIITELETGTQDVSATAVTASLGIVAHVRAALGVQNAGGNINAAITPAFHAYLSQTTEFGSADFTSLRPFDRTTNEQTMDKFRWFGIDWVVHSGLTDRKSTRLNSSH